MTHRIAARRSHRNAALPWRVSQAGISGLAVSLLAACGGGSDGPAPIPTVATVSTGAAMYSQSLVVTVTGTDVNQGLNVSSASCTGMTLSTAAPYASSASTAYYRCKVSALGAGQVTVARATDAAVLGSAAFTAPVPQVTMTVSNGSTTLGDMVMTLAPDRAPVTVSNFLNYVNTGFYTGTVFHRIATNPAVVQGGGYLPLSPGVLPTLKPTGAPIALEVGRGLSNVQWSLGMARTSALDSATSQFYVNLVDNISLDTLNGGYAVFGSVSAGTNVVAAISTAPCAAVPNVSECAPNPNILITAATQTR
jgi:cyclophilin family peptidyl-prolyl cis-trans isomerase